MTADEDAAALFVRHEASDKDFPGRPILHKARSKSLVRLRGQRKAPHLSAKADGCISAGIHSRKKGRNSMNLRFTNIFGARQSVLIAKGACLPLILLSFLLTQSRLSAQVTVTPVAGVDFGVVATGQTEDRTVTCAVNGGVTVDALTITGANASEFQIISQHFAAAPAASSVALRFTQAAAGNSPATLNIPYHRYDTATGQTITGLTTVSLTASPPTSLDFGTIPSGQTRDLTYMGGFQSEFGYSHGDSLAITGANAGDFQIVSQNFIGKTPGGDSYSIVVRFHPTAGGTRSAALELVTKTTELGIAFYYTATIPLTGVVTGAPHTLLWQNNVSGEGVYWQMLGAQSVGGDYLHWGVPANWKVVAYADITGDGQPDIIWQDDISGDVVYWQMNGVQRVLGGYITQNVPPVWRVAAVADITGDGKNDIIWQNRDTGEVTYWEMNGTQRVSGGYITQTVPPVWQVVAAGDITGDGKTDIIWQNSDNGDVVYWQMNGVQRVDGGYLSQGNGTLWRIAALCDVTGDGQNDLIWQNTANGDVKYWQMSGVTYSGTSGYMAQNVGSVWRVVGLN